MISIHRIIKKGGCGSLRISSTATLAIHISIIDCGYMTEHILFIFFFYFFCRWIALLLVTALCKFSISDFTASVIRFKIFLHALRIIYSRKNLHSRHGEVGFGIPLQTGESWVTFPIVLLEFFIDIIVPAALRPWGRFSLWQKWGLSRPIGRAEDCTTFLISGNSPPPGTLRVCPGLFRACFTSPLPPSMFPFHHITWMDFFSGHSFGDSLTFHWHSSVYVPKWTVSLPRSQYSKYLSSIMCCYILYLWKYQCRYFSMWSGQHIGPSLYLQKHEKELQQIWSSFFEFDVHETVHL